MKKLLTMLLLLFVALATNAQGIWSVFYRQTDELIGEPGGKYYKFSNDTLGSVILKEGDDWKLRVESYNGEFYSKVYDGPAKRLTAVKVLMGLYDKSGKLQEKLGYEIEGDESQSFRNAWINDDDWIYTPGQRSKFRKMVNGMLFGDGYVRIVVKRINKQNFDLKVTPYIQK